MLSLPRQWAGRRGTAVGSRVVLRANLPGSEWKFSQDRLRQLYGTVANYRHQAGVAIGHQVAQGFLLPCDAETLRLETVEKVQF